VLPRNQEPVIQVRIQAAASSRANDARDSQGQVETTWRDGNEKKKWKKKPGGEIAKYSREKEEKYEPFH
jgi:hypothetical protein